MIGNQNIPKLRFPGFDGEWKEIKLGDYITIKSGNSPSSYNFIDNGCYPFIKVEELNNCNKYQNASRFYSNEKKNLVETFSVIFPKRGAAILNNKVRINDSPVLMDSNMMAITPHRSKLNHEFLYYKIVKEELYKIADTSTIPQINNKHIEPYILFITSLPEQQKIASFLSAVDEKIQQLSRKKELVEQYKKGVMQQLFSGKLRFKDENGNKYPDWEEKKLGEVLKIGSGKDYKHLDAGNIPVFGTGGYMLSVNKFLHSGETVFIGRKGTIDKPFYFEGDFWTVDTLFYTHTFKNTIPKFIYCVFQQIDWKLHNEASGVPSLSKSTIEKLKFDFPCIEEQQKIANFLSSIDAKIENTKDELEKVQTFKKGLLQKMFV